ncbi:FAD-dependent oxidoreductase [Microbacterium sp. RG1]|uniref:FAD-dependent oxidoreductase n=1 Tax=Microbacterium sp. RG1 TaxID=2489212 RepID=UPI0010CA625E|nr:FAD-dependent oxidoreductase [Microbacterium sp. RG1]QCQ16305.1 methyltransferase domain-containing protein [Microbacterium sp. RG1]
MQNSTDVLVVGAGPAGLSAALMLVRARRAVTVVDAGSGRNRFAEHMHGVLGHEGLAPGELRARGRAEVEGYGGRFVDGSVSHLDADQDGVTVTLADGTTHRARALIVATGLSDELPDIPGLAERWGRTVLHCPYCHGWEVRDQTIGVLTTSPLGAHQAQLLTQWSDDVVVFTAGLGELDPELRHRLLARGVRLVSSPVIDVRGDGDRIDAVRTADGREVAVSAIFTAGRPVPNDGFLDGLDLVRTEGPLGAMIQVDRLGRTSHPRIWAVGNVVDPSANVPLSMGTASFVGAGVNAALVEEDLDRVAAPAAYWEHRYTGDERMWSGRVNRAVADVAASLPSGTALDLGCGEGGDALWLAEQGWEVTGVDISVTAIARATTAAASADLGERARFVRAELPDGMPEGSFDLVTASFLHSPVALDRIAILRAAASRVAVGGHLLVVSHASVPPWSHADAQHTVFPDLHEELAELTRDKSAWETVIAETRPRPVTAPDGTDSTIDDGVLLLRRR